MSTSWEPSRNAVHGLIQLIDVLAIALNRFRQLSFKLPHHHDARYQPERQRLRDDYFVVTHAVFPRADIAPQHTAARIALRAVAELVRGGSRDEAAVGDAQQWMTAAGWVLVPHAAPADARSELWRPFENEGEILSQHAAIRQRLFAALARIGQTVPDEIVQRDRLAVCPLVHEGEEPVPNDLLLRWIRETAMSEEPAPRQGTSPQFSPIVAEQLEQWRAETARFAHEAGRSATAFEAARDAFDVWMRVAYFTGHEADRDGRRATDEEVREYYVNLLLELGQTLCAIGYEERIQAIEAGTESPRLMAVELLHYAVAGDRAAVAHLDSAMRNNVFGGGRRCGGVSQKRIAVRGTRHASAGARPAGLGGPAPGRGDPYTGRFHHLG